MEPKKAYKKMKIPHHGGMKKEELKKYDLQPDEAIDFSASLNPYGPPKFILNEIKSIKKKNISFYPDPEAKELRRKLGSSLGINSNKLIITAGISELIDLIGKVFIGEGTRVLTLQHTYGEYERVATTNNENIKKVKMPNLEMEVNPIISEIENNTVTFLCNPNNPTGDSLTKADIKRILKRTKEKNSLLVIDEAYRDFLNHELNLKDLITSNLILMRSFTKIFGIPGIRIGYGITSKDNIEYLMKAKIPWNTSGISHKIAPELMKEKGKKFIKKSNKRLEKNKKSLIKKLNNMDIEYISGKANFILLEVEDASEIREELLKKGVIVRDCSSFNLPKHIRIGIRTRKENNKLIEALEETNL